MDKIRKRKFVATVTEEFRRLGAYHAEELMCSEKKKIDIRVKLKKS